jgi:lysophospholipase
LVLPGRTEFLEKYEETLQRLASRGLRAWALDLRGQGGSGRLLPDPQRGYVGAFDDYVRDVERFVTHIVEPALSKDEPLLFLGHSMGALVGLHLLRDLPTRFAAAALSAPLLGVHAPRALPGPLLGALARALDRLGAGSAYVSGGPFGPAQRRFEGNPWTSDRARFAQDLATLDANPNLILGGPTLRWLVAILAGIRAAHSPGFLGALATPILVVNAAQDRCVHAPAAARWAKLAPSATLLTLDRAEHELLRERDEVRDQLWAAVDAFFEPHFMGNGNQSS